MFGITPFERNYNLFDPFEEMSKSFFGDNKPTMCRTDIRDEGEKFILEAELAGFDKEDIKLDIEGDCLTISAAHESKNEEKDEKGRYLRRERSYGSYSRSFDISAVDADKISAEYKNGILKLDLPKKVEQPKTGRRLEIK